MECAGGEEGGGWTGRSLRSGRTGFFFSGNTELCPRAKKAGAQWRYECARGEAKYEANRHSQSVFLACFAILVT